jgi:hypothetical protein
VQRKTGRTGRHTAGADVGAWALLGVKRPMPMRRRGTQCEAGGLLVIATRNGVESARKGMRSMATPTSMWLWGHPFRLA